MLTFMVLDFGLTAIRFLVKGYKGQFYAGMTCNTHHINCLQDAKNDSITFICEMRPHVGKKKNIKHEYPGCFVALGNQIMDPDGG